MEKNTPNETFSVDDAFSLEDDDKLQVYGSLQVMNKSPLHCKQRPDDAALTQVEVEAEDDVEVGFRKLKGTSHLIPSPAHSSGRKNSNTQMSEVTRVSGKSFSEQSSWLQHPKIRENWRVVLGAFLLTLIGAVLFTVGVGIIVSPQRGMHCLVFFVGGLLCLIPGAYHLVYIYLAVKGFEGYSLYDLPVFN